MCYCYILYSKKLDRYYTGFTTLSVTQRVEKHIDEYYGNKYTAKAKDWLIFLQIECPNAVVARKIEDHIKRMKSKKYIENLVKYPEMIEKLVSRYQKG